MKPVYLTLGLLLLTACCFASMPKGLGINTLDVTCCAKISSSPIPAKVITKIVKTDPACARQSFIVHTKAGKTFCYSQKFKWALDSYNRLLNSQEASGDQA